MKFTEDIGTNLIGEELLSVNTKESRVNGLYTDRITKKVIWLRIKINDSDGPKKLKDIK